jgi:hypothetical protein
MPVQITEGAQVTGGQASEAAVYLREFLAQAAPTADTRPGSAVDLLVVRPTAEALAAARLEIAREISSRSLKAVSENPDDADPALVDALLSNYRIARKTSAFAGGQILLKLGSNTTTTITPAALFSGGGMTFRPTRTFYLTPDPDQIVDENTRLIRTVNETVGVYSTVIDVIATTPGAAGNLTAGTVLQPGGSSLPLGLQEVTAASSFGGGQDEETNAELMQRAALGIAVEGTGCRSSIRALLENKFPAVHDVSVVGAGDPEVLRSTNNPFGLPSPGYVDAYVATRREVGTMQIEAAAIFDSETSTWSAVVDQAQSAGVYRVLRVERAADALDPQPTILYTRFNAAAERANAADVVPDLSQNAHVFSRYQSVQVFFTDGSTAAAGETEMPVLLTVLYAPQLAEMHDMLNSRTYRSPGGSILVRAAVPCLVNVDLEIVRGQDDVIDDQLVEQIKAAAVDEIQKTDFAQNGLAVSRIIRRVQSLLTGRSEIRGLPALRGTILVPEPEVVPDDLQQNGQVVIQSASVLRVPTLTSRYVTPRTVRFFSDVTRISVKVSPPDQLEI